jgi:outer membrane receptor protein involved in Fe transport
VQSVRNVSLPGIVLVALLFLLPVYAVAASTTGKIAGEIIEAKTGTPVVGATVRLKNFSQGAITDSDGEFYLVNVPVGEHTVIVQMIGYETVEVTGIRVLTDLTTPVDVDLSEAPVELDQTVTVVARRPLIQRDQTSSAEIVTRDQIVNLANTRNTLAVISNMAGTVVEADSALHVRGGRQGTVTYLLDGFSVQDPFTGGLGMRISPDALEELSLTSGGLAPEYGEATSGVINAITREGGNDFHGRVKVYDGLTQQYDVNSSTWGGLTRTDNNAATLDLSGPIAQIGSRMATFFGAFEYQKNSGYLPHSEFDLVTGIGKVVLFPLANLKLSFNGAYYFRDKQRYVHRDVNGVSYDFNLDGLGKIENTSYLGGVKATYNKSANTVFSMNLSRFYAESRQAPEHLFDLYWDQWPGYSVDENGVYDGTIDDDNYNYAPEYYHYGFTTGDDYYPYFLDRYSKYDAFQVSVLSQVDKHNQIKIGGEARWFDLHWDNKQFFNQIPYGEKYDVFPTTGVAYMQDKIELQDMIINVGLRFDYLFTDKSYWNDPITRDYVKEASAKTMWSPRLGISHPLSENAKLHFNYGYMFQPPPFLYMYTNLQADLNTGRPLIGNPELDAEKTISYELGLTQMLRDDLRMTVTTFYRDVKDMVSSREVLDGDGNVYAQFVNADYGSVKGLNLTMDRISTSFLTWSINYSYMFATGNTSDPFEGYYFYIPFTGDEDVLPYPVREYPLAYDQRHTLTANIDFTVPHGETLEMFGKKMPDAWSVGILAKYGSGLPYTRTDLQNRRIGLPNDDRMPYTLRFDLRFDKHFYFTKQGGSYFTFFTEVENLFDRRNVVNVYPATGDADFDGFVVQNVFDPNYEDQVRVRSLYSHDPQNYDHPRQIRFGVAYSF